MVGVYKEICILNFYELNNIDMDEYFFDLFFSNDYVFIVFIVLVLENELYLELIIKIIIIKF